MKIKKRSAHITLPFSWLFGLIASLSLSVDTAAPAFFLYVPAVTLWLYRFPSSPKTHGVRAFAATSFVTMLGFFTGVFHWFFSMYPLTFVGITSRAVAFFTVLFCDVGLAALQSLLLLPIFLLCYAVATRALYRRHAFLVPVLFSLFYTLGELSQELFWFGVPWGTLALSQVHFLPLLQTASLFGKAGLTFAVMLTNAAIAYALLLFVKRSPEERKRHCRNAGVILAATAVFLSTATLTGSALLHARDGKSASGDRESVYVALIQPDISGLEYQSYTDYEIFTVCAHLVREAKDAGAEVAVWTETIFVHALDRGRMQDNIAGLARELSMPQYVGAYYEEWETDGKRHLYNALYYFDENGTLSETVYKKRRLVPFGEFVPLAPLVNAVLPSLAAFLRSECFTQGKEPEIFDTKNGKVGSLLCFDSIYPVLSRDSTLSGAEYLILPTNDSWFLGSIALAQHEYHAALRAAENGRYIARCAPTGISAFIADTGEILSELPDGAGFLVGRIEREAEMTLYTLIGNTPVIAAVILASLAPLLHFGVSCCYKRKKPNM